MKYISTKKIKKMNKQENGEDLTHWYSTEIFDVKEIKYITPYQLHCVYYPSKIDLEEWTKLYYLFDQHNNLLKLKTLIF